VDGLEFITWCELRRDSGWRLKATLPNGSSDWVPAPGPVPEDVPVFQRRDHFLTPADVWWTAQWLARRYVLANPEPRSIPELAGWEHVQPTDPRLAPLRQVSNACLWWARAVTDFAAGAETQDVERAWTALEQARGAWTAKRFELHEQAITSWRRQRHAEQRRDERIARVMRAAKAGALGILHAQLLDTLAEADDVPEKRDER
jgi:hypothetical protein